MAGRKKNLSMKFALTCILPASLLLVGVCCISLMFTSKSLIHSLKKSMEGQSASKIGSVTESINSSISSAAFPKRASEIQTGLKDNSTEEINDTIIMIKTRSPQFSSVELYDLTSGRIYTGEDVSEFSELPFWYDRERFISDRPYYKSQDITSDENLTLLTYIYPFCTDGNDEPDMCFAASIDNRVPLKTLALGVAVQESKWMILSADDKIIYHSAGYNGEIFDEVEKRIKYYDSSQLVHTFMGSKVVLQLKEMPDLDNIKLLYVVPVGAVIRDSNGSIVLVIVLTVISIAILAFFIRLMTKKIVKEINAVRASLKGIRNKQYIGSIKSETQDEMGELVEDFNSVIEFLTYQAEHDENTGFYNAKAFSEKAHLILNSDNRRENYSVIRVDIDKFSFINDIFDWEVGNQILLKISLAIRSAFGENALYGYLGNDIFVVLYGYENRDEMISLVMKASDCIKECEDRIHLVPHFGISDDVMPDSDISVVCDCAGVALKTVKGSLLQVYAVYDDRFKENHNTQKFVENNKQKALDNGEFFIQLQPKCDAETGRVVGAEALVRWRLSELNETMPPKKFISIFEKNGFIIPLDKYVWEETCRVMKSWHERGFREIPVSVNVSRVHINNPNLAKELSELVEKYDIRPELLEIEITESALVENSEIALEPLMKELKERGFRLLMDDFASGYSSLLSLQKLPFDVIKMDKALIDHIDENEKKKFVAGTVSFLYEIGKEIVVEGVETPEQVEILRETGCTVIQGYCFSRPLDIEDFEKMAFGSDSEQ